MKPEPLRILILEDYEPAIEVLKQALARHFAGAQLTIKRTAVDLQSLSAEQPDRFDVILLDYYCAAGGNFHTAPLEHFGLKKVISISSTSGGNQLARQRGITRIVPKHIHDLEAFAKAVTDEIERLLPHDQQRRTDEFASGEERLKKQRERSLIEEFLAVVPSLAGWEFSFYDENPDLVYVKDGQQLGFESVIIATDSPTADCYFDKQSCTLHTSGAASGAELETLRTALVTHVLDHLRHYKLPTVIVLTVIGSPVDLHQLAAGLKLPQLLQDNIQDYYLISGKEVLKVVETAKPY